VALFRKKSTEGKEGDASAAGRDGFQPQPEKAAKWFEFAKSAADAYNYDYALSCYANGIKLDPEAFSAHEQMYEAGVQYANRQGKPASGKEIRGIEGPHPIDKFAAAEFAWLKEITNASLALGFAEAAAKAMPWAGEVARWHAQRILNVSTRSKKPSKSHFIKLKDLFAQVGAWDEAIKAGEAARQLDPSDNALASELKDLAAQRAMDQGGYEAAAGKEGGFRQFVKDIDKQRALEEAESLAAGSSVEQRNLDRARKEYEQSPHLPDLINKYAQLLKRQGTPDATEQALQVLNKGFQETGEFRFRRMAGEIRIDRGEKQFRELEEQLKTSPGDAAMTTRVAAAREELLRLKSEELNQWTERYPTDRGIRYQLGQVEYELGRTEEAMACFQAAKDEPKLRVRAGHMLGLCFAREGWHQEAIGEFKEALTHIDATERDRELMIRYDLMVSLIEHARVERSAELAREALEICSGIARKDITYRDIRAKRKEIDQVMRELSGSPSS
jgi:tetratricopeptide (TPR) repeat protein